jgi:hypothetical protein
MKYDLISIDKTSRMNSNRIIFSCAFNKCATVCISIPASFFAISLRIQINRQLSSKKRLEYTTAHPDFFL